MAPTIPPNADCNPNADLKISANKAGTCWILIIIMTIAINIYMTAINGTTAVATLAIERNPPKIINAKIMTTIIATIHSEH